MIWERQRYSSASSPVYSDSILGVGMLVSYVVPPPLAERK